VLTRLLAQLSSFIASVSPWNFRFLFIVGETSAGFAFTRSPRTQ